MQRRRSEEFEDKSDIKYGATEWMRIGGPNLSLQGRVFFFTAVVMTLAQAVDANVSHQLQEVLAVPVAHAAHLH